MVHTNSQRLLVAFGLLLSLLASAQARDVKVGNANSAGRALTDDTVDSIGVLNSIDLTPFSSQLLSQTSNGANPYVLSRNLVIYSAQNSGGVTLDFAYLAGLMKISSGITVTIKDLTLRRMELGIPFATFQNSPGALVILQNVDSRLQVCPNARFTNAFFLNSQYVTRPSNIPGTNTAGPFPDGGPYPFTDLANNIIVTADNLGGYTLWFQNSHESCDLVVDSPADQCPELANDPPGPLTDTCFWATRNLQKSTTCSQPGCINFCPNWCSAPNRTGRKLMMV